VSRTDAIRAEIGRTRTRLDQAADALRQRLDPEELVHGLFETARANAGEVGHALMRTVRDNQLPTALIGAGLVWLLLKQARGPSSQARPFDYRRFARYDELEDFNEYGDSAHPPPAGALVGGQPRRSRLKNRVTRAGNTVRRFRGRAVGTIEEFGSHAMERMHRMSHYMRHKTSGLGERVQHRAHSARQRFSQTTEEYPLVVGIAFFTLGLACGAAFPTTRSENRVLGRARDRLMHQAQDVGSHLIDRGQEAAERAVGAVKDVVARSRQHSRSRHESRSRLK